jgi:EmrB/QacA subfamily drug resistance transporter
MPEISERVRRAAIVGAMGGVLGLILLDETVVGVALPVIRRELGLSTTLAGWVINAYLLVFSALAAAAGRLGDAIGVRRIFLLGVATFGLASVASGLAQGPGSLIAARVVQGIGAAVIFPASLSMVTLVFDAEERGIALGICGSIGTVFLAVGPLVGGFFTEVVSWRWIFFVNPVLVVLIGGVVAVVWRDPPIPPQTRGLDGRGLAALCVGLGLLVFGVMQGPDWGWSQPVVATSIAVGLVVLAAFAVLEHRSASPLIEVDLFARPTFAACSLVIFSAQVSKIAVIVFGSFYLQDALGLGPLAAGLALLPAVVPNPLTGVLAGHLADRFGARGPALWGVAVSAAAVIWVGALLSREAYGVLVPALVLWGGAISFLFVPPQRALMNAVPAEQQGQAAGINMTAQLLGGTIGMSVCSTVFAVTGSFTAVFLVTGAVLLGVLAFGWRAIDRGV